MNDRDEAETALYQSDRNAYNNRAIEDLLDRFFGRQTQEEFDGALEFIKVALEEATTEEMTDPKPCIGHMTCGILDNVIDLSNIWALRAERRGEFDKVAMLELERAEKFLSDLLDKIAEQEI